MGKTATEETRAFRMSLDIDASPDDVWRALTDAEELVRWFPLEARVTPGAGGTMLWSWGGSQQWQCRIDAWEPGRLLRLVDEEARPFDANGRMLPAGAVESARIAIEFTLETHQGKTRLKLVHSGFGHGEAWDSELDGITEGWQAELRGLRHYLQRHRGRDRQVGMAMTSTTTPRDAAWARLTGPGGYQISPAVPESGGAYQVTTPTGERLSGTVALYLHRITLAGTVRELDDAWLRLLTWRDATGKTGVWVWLATYSGDSERVRTFGKGAEETLQRLFPAT